LFIEYFDDVSITDPEKYLDSASRGILDAIKGTLIRESKITLAGYPGRELELSLTASRTLASVTVCAVFGTFQRLIDATFPPC